MYGKANFKFRHWESDLKMQYFYWQFFTYNEENEACGIRSFCPSNVVKATGQQTGTKFTILDNKDVVFVGFATKTDTPEECQASCQVSNDNGSSVPQYVDAKYISPSQADPKCFSFTWNSESSDNPLICVHNYGQATRTFLIPFPLPTNTIVSGPRCCPGDCCCKNPNSACSGNCGSS